jgi:hypothetical protein
VIYWTIFSIGSIVIIYSLRQILWRKDAQWISILKEKASNPILRGFTGFIVIGVIAIFLPAISQFIIDNSNLIFYNLSLYFFTLIASFSVLLVLFLWLGTRTKYESNVSKLNLNIKSLSKTN